MAHPVYSKLTISIVNVYVTILIRHQIKLLSAHNITFSITYFMNSLPNLLNNKYRYHKSVFIPINIDIYFLSSYHIVLSFQNEF